MRRIVLSIRALLAVLFNAAVAGQFERILGGESSTEEAARGQPAAEEKPTPSAAPPKSVRSEATTLLAALQREARFVDFVKEPLDEYSDEQIGAAARDVHRLCGELFERMFQIRPLLSKEEGSPMEVAEGFDAGRFRLTGKVGGEPPFRGQLVHHGWQVLRCDVPEWSGEKESASVVAPAEVEVQE